MFYILLGPFCGDDPPDQFNISGNVAHVLFKTDESEVDKGFILDWHTGRFIPRKQLVLYEWKIINAIVLYLIFHNFLVNSFLTTHENEYFNLLPKNKFISKMLRLSLSNEIKFKFVGKHLYVLVVFNNKNVS